MYSTKKHSYDILMSVNNIFCKETQIIASVFVDTNIYCRCNAKKQFRDFKNILQSDGLVENKYGPRPNS